MIGRGFTRVLVPNGEGTENVSEADAVKAILAVKHFNPEARHPQPFGIFKTCFFQ